MFVPVLTRLGEAIFVIDKSASAMLAPNRGTVCGLPLVLSAIAIVPNFIPPAVGLNDTLTEQLAPTGIGRAERQLLVETKSPPTEISEMLSGALPLLITVSACGLLVVPTAWLGKVRLAGIKLTAGP